LLDDKAPRKGKPTQTPVKRQQMLLADEQGKGYVMVVLQRGGCTAEGRARVAPTLGLRMGFHAPYTPDFHWHTV
jgi:hypothetical protein